MSFYKREFTGFRFEIRLERLGPADLVTERCIVCEFRRVVSPWEMLAKSSPAVALVSVLGGPCPDCGYPSLLWGVATAVWDERFAPPGAVFDKKKGP